MKNRNTKARYNRPGIIKTLIITLVTIILLIISPGVSTAQNGNPPPPPGEHGQNGNQPPGGGAPVGSGSTILLWLGAAYGGQKLYKFKRSMHRGVEN